MKRYLRTGGLGLMIGCFGLTLGCGEPEPPAKSETPPPPAKADAAPAHKGKGKKADDPRNDMSIVELRKHNAEKAGAAPAKAP